MHVHDTPVCFTLST